DLPHVLLPAADRVQQVRDAPAQRDVHPQRPAELPGGLGGVRVAPGAERGQLPSVGGEGEVAVHHPGDPQARQLRELDAMALADVAHEVRVAVLDAGEGVVEGVGPAVVDELVLPGVGAGAQHGAAVVDQGGLDAGRAELEPQVGATFGEEGGRIGAVGGGRGVVHHVSTKPSPPTDGNVHIHGGTAGPTRVDGWSGTRADGRYGARGGGGGARRADGRGGGPTAAPARGSAAASTAGPTVVEGARRRGPDRADQALSACAREGWNGAPPAAEAGGAAPRRTGRPPRAGTPGDAAPRVPPRRRA